MPAYFIHNFRLYLGSMTPNLLKEKRLKKEMVVWELAAEANVSPATISGIERYGYRPSRATMERLASALDVEVADIWPKAEAAVSAR